MNYVFSEEDKKTIPRVISDLIFKLNPKNQISPDSYWEDHRKIIEYEKKGKYNFYTFFKITPVHGERNLEKISFIKNAGDMIMIDDMICRILGTVGTIEIHGYKLMYLRITRVGAL